MRACSDAISLRITSLLRLTSLSPRALPQLRNLAGNLGCSAAHKGEPSRNVSTKLCGPVFQEAL